MLFHDFQLEEDNADTKLCGPNWKLRGSKLALKYVEIVWKEPDECDVKFEVC